MATFTLFVRLLAPVPILVGLLHLVLGLGTDVLLGAAPPAEAIGDPVLDSQNRFYGVVFMAYGVLLFLCASNLRKYATVFRIVVGFVFLGGVARIVSIALYGLPTAPVIALILIELVGMPPVLWWHSRVLGSS